MRLPAVVNHPRIMKRAKKTQPPKNADYRISFWVFVLVAVTLHAGLILWFPLVKTTAPEKLIEVSVIASEEKAQSGGASTVARPGKIAASAGRKADAGGSGNSGSSPRPLSLTDLSVGSAYGPSEGPQGYGQQPLGVGSGSSPILDEARGTVTFRALYQRIDQVLTYPPELSAAGFEGFVKADLALLPSGELDKKRSRVVANSPYLRVHVLRVLRRALQEKLPESWLKQTRGLLFKCVFQFELVGDTGDIAHSADSETSGKSLTFYRAGKPWGQWSIGPFTGYGAMPAVGVDPSWFTDELGLSHSKPVDPLKSYREDPDWRS